MACLRAFTDDSASDVGDRRLFMAGYLDTAEKWARFSEAWDEELRADPAIEYLKMAEAQNLRDQFKGWTETARDEKLRGFVRVVRRFQPQSFDFSINRESFYRIVRPASPRGLVNAHFAGCFAVVSGLARFAASQRGNIPIEFIFDQQEGVDRDIQFFFDEMKKNMPKKARNLIAGTPIFKDDKDHRYLPLQAADLLAWHLRRQHENGSPISMAYLLCTRTGHIRSGLDDATMQELADKNRTLPGIDKLQSKEEWRSIKHEIERFDALGIDAKGRKRLRDYWHHRLVQMLLKKD